MAPVLAMSELGGERASCVGDKCAMLLVEEMVGVTMLVLLRVTVDVRAEVATVNVPEPVPVVVKLPAPIL